jgi:hypothetical protein
VKLKLSNALFLLMFAAGFAQADSTYKPYVLATAAPDEVKTKLAAEGFEVVGEYKPYDGAIVIVVTSEALKKTAAQSDKGGYGAAVRVAITGKPALEGETQVSYSNPKYWANGYRMATDLNDVATALEKALGNNGQFGSEEGLSKSDLREYQYTWGMPDFEDQIKLAEHATYDKAVSTVEKNLKDGKGDTQFVYRVDVSDKNETVFGMGVKKGKGGDEHVMTTLNHKTHTAYMPYEILVSGKEVYMLPGRFRIALSFPDLSMGAFMKIFSAPGAIKEAGEAVAE